MKKVLLSMVVIASVCSFHLFAQPILPNNSFENWETTFVNDSIPIGQHPVGGYDQFMFATSFGANCARHDEAHTGSSAIRVFNNTISTDSVTGETTAGAFMHRFPVSSHPKKMSLYTKHFFGPEEKGVIAVGYIVDGENVLLGTKSLSGKNSTYTKTDVYLNYEFAEAISDTMVIIVTSYNAFAPSTQRVISDSSFVVFDDITFEGIQTSVGPNVIEDFTTQDFTEWQEFYGFEYPSGWIFDGFGNNNITRTTDGVDDASAVRMEINAIDTVSLGLVHFKKSAMNQSIEFYLKYDLLPTDNIAVGVGPLGWMDEKNDNIIPSAFLVLTGSQATYKKYSLDISNFATGDTIDFVIAIADGEAFTNGKLAGAGPSYLHLDKVSVSDIVTYSKTDAILYDLSVYPNPSSNGKFILNNYADGNMKVTDAIGNTVNASYSVQNGSTLIDLSQANRGVYFVNVEGKKTFKLVY